MIEVTKAEWKELLRKGAAIAALDRVIQGDLTKPTIDPEVAVPAEVIAAQAAIAEAAVEYAQRVDAAIENV